MPAPHRVVFCGDRTYRIRRNRSLPVKLGRGMFLQGDCATSGRSYSPIRAMAARLGAACRNGVTSVLVIAACSVSYGAGAAGPGTKPRIAFAGDSIVDNYWSGVARNIEANTC